jgi:putative oxidoreductase
LRALEGLHTGWGVTVVRVMMGIILTVSGYQKFGVMGLGAFSGFLGQMGIPAPEIMGPLVAAVELIGGILVLVGLGTRWVGWLFVIEFLVTTFYIKFPRMGWDATRIDLMILAAAIMLVVAGSGKASVDDVLIKRRSETGSCLSSALDRRQRVRSKPGPLAQILQALAAPGRWLDRLSHLRGAASDKTAGIRRSV